MEDLDKPGGKILIVDDTVSVINMIKTALLNEGYQIFIATSGENAIKSAKLAKPDLILLDILMPEMDGYETCLQLKADEDIKDIPVLFMSALTDVFDKVKAFSVGAVDYVTKPLNVEELKARVRTQVSLSIMQRKLKDTNKWLEEKVEERTRELKESQEKYKTVADFNYDWEYWVLPDGSFEYISPSCEKITGYKPEEFVTNKTLLDDIVHEKDLKIWQDHGVEDYKNETKELIFRIKTKENKTRWIGHLCRPVYTDNGESVGVRVSNRDITDRIKAELTLKERNEELLTAEEEIRATNDELKDNIDRLYDSEKKYRELTENLPDVLISIDRNYKINYVNRQLLNMRPEDAIGKTILELYGERGNHVSAKQRIDKVFETGEKDAFEKLVETKYGVFFFKIKLAPVYSGSEITNLIYIISDVTKEKNLEKEIAANEERYRKFIQLSREGIHRWEFKEPMPLNLSVEEQAVWITEKQYLAECNDAFAKMYSFEKSEEIVGKKLADLEGNKESALAINRQFVENNYSWTNFETEEVTKSGKRKFFLNNLIGIIENEKLVRLWGTQADITERKKAEIRLKEEKDKAQMYLDTAGVMFIALDTKGNITLLNKAGYKLLQVESPDEVIGTNWVENFIPSDEKEKIGELFNETMQESIELVEHYENKIVTKKGEVRVLAWHNAVLKNENGDIIGLLSSAEDVTEQRQAEEAYRTLVDNSLQGLIILQDSHIKFANRQIAEISGYPIDDILAFSIENIYSVVYEKDRDWVVAKMYDLINGIDKSQHLEFRFVMKDGTIKWTETFSSLIQFKGKQALQVAYIDITSRKLAEEHILKEKNRATNILQATNAGTWNWNVQTGEVWNDERWCSIIGYNLDELTPLETDFWQKNMHPEDLERTSEILQNHLNGETDYYEAEFRQKHKDGSWVWVMGRGKVIEWTGDGKPLRMYGTHLDISKRKLVEEELKNRNKFIQTVLDRVPIGIALNKFDKGDAIYMNKKFEEIYGWPFDELKSVATFFEKVYPDKEYREKIQKMIMEDINSGIIENMHWENIEITSKNGTKRIVNAANIPLFEQNTMVSTVLDFTTQREYEIELEKHRNSLELLVKERTDELEASNEELEVTNDELHLQKNKLEKIIEELNKTQTKLIQSEKMASLGVLVAGVAHEINNPVNFINSSLAGLKNNLKYLSDYSALYTQLPENVETVIAKIKEKEKEVSLTEVLEMFKRSIEIIEVGIERTTKIVKGLKAFARSDEKRLESYDIHESIDNTLLILYNQFKNRIRITKNFGSIPEIECFPSQINQVIMNVLNNAIQAIDGDGEVTITTNLTDGDQVITEIKDSGKGIPQEQLKHIFDPFFTTKDVGKGTGLGLSISYGIVRDHHGEILVESELGRGTTFRISLPVKQ